MVLTSQKQVLKVGGVSAVNWFCVLQAIFLKSVLKCSCQVMSLRLKKSILLFKSNLHALNKGNLTESITLNWDGKLGLDEVVDWFYHEITSWARFIPRSH